MKSWKPRQGLKKPDLAKKYIYKNKNKNRATKKNLLGAHENMTRIRCYIFFKKIGYCLVQMLTMKEG